MVLRRERHGRAVGSALTDLCRGLPPTLPEGQEAAEAFVVAARFHRLAPLAHVALRDSRPDVAGLLRVDRDRAVLHHLRMVGVLGRLATILEGFDWVVFKGAVLSETAHPVPGIRFYKDLDLLVGPQDLRGVSERLQAAGWFMVLPDESLRGSEVPGEVPMVSLDQVAMDLHWSLLLNEELRRSHNLATRPLLDRRVPVRLGPTSVWTLEPSDALLHICFHATEAGAMKLGHLLDVDQLARNDVDWDAVARRSRDARVEAQVGLSVERARRLLGTPVPAEFTRLLGLSRGFDAVTGVVDTLWPASRVHRDRSWPRRIALGVGRTGTATMVNVTRNGLARGVELLGRPKPKRMRRPSSAEAVEDYLGMVEATVRGT